ncbi:hypothetical protein ACTQ53_06725 [Prevotella sp. Sow4_E9_plate]|uniref:hypothetical protein n=1 Tax=Prevotella sp. Sow4_E9_plate TaxID=3438802 RepID=UPI003F9BE790
MKLHIFNPEHDLALASNLRQFTAPHAGRQLRSDLSFIPALWADEGDLVLVDDIDNARDKVRHLGGDLVDKVEFITKVQLAHFIKTEFLDSVHPWGWDLSLKGELEHIGIPEIALPGDAILNKVRAISSRQWAAEHLQSGVRFVQSVAEVKSLVREWGKAVIKAPWSSSGRGVRFVSADEFREGSGYPSFERWVGNIIYRQGGVTVEPYYNKVMDFGMEFEMVDGKVLYRGLSLFDTIKNAYSGNVLCPEDKKVEMMARYVSPERLLQIRQHVIDVMEPALKGIYSGPFGVDMMIYVKEQNLPASDGASSDVQDDFGVNECIEVNLRRTMGHVAIDLADYLQETSSELNQLMRVEFDGNRYHLRVLPGQPSAEAPLH